MHILADYFLPLLKAEGIDLDENYIKKLITWHDMSEAFVGDMVTNCKTEEHKQKELESEITMTKTGPEHMRKIFTDIFDNYNDLKSIEAKFVKAIDKIEPQVHLYFLLNNKRDVSEYFYLGWTADEYREHRKPYVSQFELIKRFDDLLFQKISVSNFHR